MPTTLLSVVSIHDNLTTNQGAQKTVFFSLPHNGSLTDNKTIVAKEKAGHSHANNANLEIVLQEIVLL